MMEDAKNQGAELIALPECATRLDPYRRRLKSSADTMAQSEILKNSVLLQKVIKSGFLLDQWCVSQKIAKMTGL